MRRIIATAVYVAVLIVGARGTGAQEPEAVAENTAFRVVVPGDRDALARELLDIATQARVAISEQSRAAIPFQTTVQWCDTEDEFEAATGQRPESVVAAASSRSAMIWINGPQWQRTGVQEALPILIHEYAHVVVGTLSNGRLPRWANEGLAMHLAGQWTLTDGFNATRSQTFGGLPGLREIDGGFPTDPDGLRRAYWMSYLAIEHFARSLGAKPGSVDPILDRLRDPDRGHEFIDSMWDPVVRGSIESAARAALGNSAKRWIIYLSSGTTLWMLIVALFVWAYWRKRRRVQAAERHERREDAWAESLTQQDIEDIYGEPKDTVDEDEKRPWE